MVFYFKLFVVVMLSFGGYRLPCFLCYRAKHFLTFCQVFGMYGLLRGRKFLFLLRMAGLPPRRAECCFPGPPSGLTYCSCFILPATNLNELVLLVLVLVWYFFVPNFLLFLELF